MATPSGDFFVLSDTREQDGWEFRKGHGCLGQEVVTLSTGDYTVRGHETKVVIERKGSAAELAGNLFEARFMREFERLRDFPHAFVVCEFPFKDLCKYPYIPAVPFAVRKRVKVKGPLLLKKLVELQMDFPTVQWKFADDRESAKAYARSVFKRIVERNA